MGVMLQRDSQNQRLYIHDVVLEKEASGNSQEHLSTKGPYKETKNLSITNILKKAIYVNPKYYDALNQGDMETAQKLVDAAAKATGYTVKAYHEYIKGGNAMGINPYLSDAEYAKIKTIDWTEGEDLREFLIDNGYDYDGLVLDEGADGGYGDAVQSRGTSWVVFSHEQVKNIDNVNPTADPDIRFSLSGEDTLPGNYGNYRVSC